MFVARDGDIDGAILTLSIFTILLNFRNLRRGISKRSSQEQPYIYIVVYAEE
jgi:hypothetical protein